MTQAKDQTSTLSSYSIPKIVSIPLYSLVYIFYVKCLFDQQPFPKSSIFIFKFSSKFIFISFFHFKKCSSDYSVLKLQLSND